MGKRTPREAIEKKISNAWWAALISAAITFLFAFISLGGEPIAGIDAWGFADGVLILGLAFGVSRKSRTCAVVLFVYFVGSKLLMWTEAGNVRGLPVALLFMWYFAQGVVGTFQYHGLAESDAEPPGVLYRPAGAGGGTPWLVWTALGSVALVGAGAAWYYKSSRQLHEAPAAAITHQDIQEAVAMAVGRLNRVEMNGAASPLGAAIAVDERAMLVPCNGISPGAPLFVKMASRDIRVELEKADDGIGLCRLILRDIGPAPLQLATAPPKVGDSIFAASFGPGGKVVISPGQVRKVSTGARGTVIESSARAGAPPDGTPLLDAMGRVLAIALEGEDTTVPAGLVR